MMRPRADALLRFCASFSLIVGPFCALGLMRHCALVSLIWGRTGGFAPPGVSSASVLLMLMRPGAAV
eukprot:8963257-Alexandrium_andersonii.AAC.1